MKKLMACCALAGALSSTEAVGKDCGKTSAVAVGDGLHTVTVRLTDEELALLRKMRGADPSEKLRNAIHDQAGGVFVLCRFDLKADADRKAYVGKTLDIVPTVRAERGCRVYTLLEDAKTDWEAPQRFGERTLWMLERWDSIEALKAHLQTPHMKAFGPTVRGMREKGTFHVLQEV